MVVTNLDSSLQDEDYFYDNERNNSNIQKSIIYDYKQNDEIDVEAMNESDDSDYLDLGLNLAKTGADVVIAAVGGLALFASNSFVGKEQFWNQFLGGAMISFGMVRFPINFTRFVNEVKKRKEAKKLMKIR